MDTKLSNLIVAVLKHSMHVVEEYVPEAQEIQFMGIPLEIEVTTDIPDSALEVLSAYQIYAGDFPEIKKILSNQIKKLAKEKAKK